MKKKNQGFSLIELLIAVTILSIVMIMVVQFMSTSALAYRKQKKNLSVQTKAMTTMEQLSDTLMQANYIRIKSLDGKTYTVKKGTNGKNSVSEVGKIDYQLVPDNYGNYSAKCSYTDNKDAIVNFNTFDIVDEKGNAYPKSGESDYVKDVPVKSFRALNAGGTYQYIIPHWIYAEYASKDSSVTTYVVYYFTDVKNKQDNTRNLLVYRTTSKSWKVSTANFSNIVGYVAAHENDASTVGIMSEDILNFYISADPEGNALLTNVEFKDDGYEYNAVETIKFRNSNVLTVRPQKLKKVKGTGNP